jgi:hypothetical protein
MENGVAFASVRSFHKAPALLAATLILPACQTRYVWLTGRTEGAFCGRIIATK